MKRRAALLTLLVAAVLAFALAPFVRSGSAGSWDAAHAAGAEAFATRGTFAIDGTLEEFTAHRARVATGGHVRTYPSSPPLPSLVAAAPLKFGATRSVATFVTATLPAALALVLLVALARRSASRETSDERRRDALVIAVALAATPLAGFGTVMTGLPLALLGCASGLLAHRAQRPLASGACFGFAAACEPSALVYVLLFVPRRGLLAYAAGAALPLALHVSILSAAGASPFGFGGDQTAFALAFSDLPHLTRGPDPFDGAWWDALVGARGSWLHFPAALFGLALLALCVRRGAPSARRSAVAAALLLVLGCVPEQPARTFVPAAHLLIAPLVFAGAAHLEFTRRARLALALLALLSLPGALRAVRSPCFTWHLASAFTPTARLGLPREHTENLWFAEWGLAAVDRPPGRERLSTEFEARLELVARAVLDAPQQDAAAVETLRRGLGVVADRFERENTPTFARPLVHYQLGRAHLALGDAARAERSLRTCLELYPSFTAARELLESLPRGE